MMKHATYRVIFASILALALPSFAMAASPSHVENIAAKISYDDLNIRSEAGAKVLYARLERASKRACGVRSFTETGSVKWYVEARECFDDTLAAAVRKINSTELTKIHTS